MRSRALLLFMAAGGHEVEGQSLKHDLGLPVVLFESKQARIAARFADYVTITRLRI
jgi:hypothetical protein